MDTIAQNNQRTRRLGPAVTMSVTVRSRAATVRIITMSQSTNTDIALITPTMSNAIFPK